jgi:autotransporter-associated beta strand protein
VNIGTVTLNGKLGGGLTNAVSTTITGTGTNNGVTDISGTLFPGASNVVGTITAAGGLILESGATVGFDLGGNTTPGSGSNDLIAVTGDLTVNGNTINMNPLALLKTGVPYRLFNYTGNLIWNSDLSIPDVIGYHFAFNTNTPGQVNVIVSGGPPVWTGGSATDSNWSDAGNWSATIGSGTLLYFAGTTRLNNTNDTTADTSYGDVVFNVDAGAFVLNGNPVLLGGNINNISPIPQTVRLGVDFDAVHTLGGGGPAAPLIIGGGLTNVSTGNTNTISLAGTGFLTNLLNSTSGTGTNTISMTSSNGNWTLMDNAASAPNSIPWAFDIRAGTFNFGSASSAPTLSTTTQRGAPQDNQVGITTGGTGTLNISNGVLTINARLNTATVLNSTGIVNVVGGTFNCNDQFQGANGGNAGEVSILNVSGGAFNIGATTNPGQIYVASRGQGTFTVSASAAVNCGTLDVSRDAQGNTIGSVGVVNLNGGTLSCSRIGTATANSQPGPASTGPNPSATFSFNGGVLKATGSDGGNPFFQGSTATPAIPISTIVKSGGAIIDTGTNTISILEALQHDSSLVGIADGGLKKVGSGSLTLSASNNYTGNTIVSNGTLVVNGSLGLTAVTVSNTATLAGTGSFGSNVIISVGGTISPGGFGAVGTLTIASNLALQGNTVMELNRPTNDVLRASTIVMAGTLTVSNIGPHLNGGDSFTLLSGTLSGSFASTALPALWPGLSWINSLSTLGKISVTGTIIPPNISSFGVVSGNFNLSGSGGLAGTTYYVVASTNVAAPLATWQRVATNTFDNSGNFSASLPIDPNNPDSFYRIQVP